MLNIRKIALAMLLCVSAYNATDIGKVLSLGFYLIDSSSRLTATKEGEASIKLKELKLLLDSESVKELANSTQYNTVIEKVEFKAAEPTSLTEEEVNKINEIAKLITIKKKQSTASWWNVWGHDWFEVDLNDLSHISVKMEKENLGAAGPVPNQRISLGVFDCKYQKKEGVQGYYDNANELSKASGSISFPVDLLRLSKLSELSEGKTTEPVLIDGAKCCSYEGGNLKPVRTEKVQVKFSRTDSKKLKLEIVYQSMKEYSGKHD